VMLEPKANSEFGMNALPAITQSAVFHRAEEVEQLRRRLAVRRSFLFHGPAGVGKTLLLSLVLPEFPDILYSPKNPTPQALYRNLAELLLAARHPSLTSVCWNGMSSLQTKTAVSTKGLVRDALWNSKYLVVLDHLMRPSPALGGAIRELMLNCSVPVVAVSRSAHMEDVGFVLPLFPDRTEKFNVRNFDPETARLFAGACADSQQLAADNLAQFLDRVVEYSDGNPGAMLRMICMAKNPRYSHGNQIKVTPLYIDYKIAMISQ
jgi:hypothetical protein